VKKNKVLIVVGILVILIGYFGYKMFNLVYYHSFDYEYDNIDDLEIERNIKLNYHKELEKGEEYLEFKNIKIRNDFKDFEYKEEISNEDVLKYVLYDKDNGVEASFWLGVTDTYVEMLKSDIDIYAYNRKGIEINSIKDFLKDKGISNDIHLFKYLVEHKNDKINIFTSVKEMKGRYALNSLMDIMLPEIEEITLINGTYAGYILEADNDVREVHILYYDKSYVFTFIGDDYFSDEYIYELLDTLVIESVKDYGGTFTRTYSIVEEIDNNSIKYDSFRVRQFQVEEVVVDIKKELARDIELGKTYEFTFKKDIDSKIEDNIKSIFNGCELISVIETDKIGLEQVQDQIK